MNQKIHQVRSWFLPPHALFLTACFLMTRYADDGTERASTSRVWGLCLWQWQGCGWDGGVGVTVGAAVWATNPVPCSTGARPLAEASFGAPLLPLHLLGSSSSSKGVAGGEQDCVLVFSLPVGSTCWPEIWSSWFTHRPRALASPKLLIDCVSVR